MKTHSCSLAKCCTAILVLGSAILGPVLTEAAPAPMGPLGVHPDNPRYFQNKATGKPVYLTGSHVWYNLVDMGPSDPPPSFDYDGYLNWLEKRNHNFMRMWAWELVHWNTSGNSPSHRNKNPYHHVVPQPWLRTGPGRALDGKPKFNLDKFNPVYFERLQQRVAAARAKGIYAAIMLFEGWGLQFSPNAWKSHPFHPGNNRNGINGDANGDTRGVEIHELGQRRLTALQEAYVRKVIDTVNHLDNVLYEISNENHPASTDWQYHMIRFIKDYEKTKPHRHPVGMTFQYKGGSNQALFRSPADWVSPNSEGGYRDNPPANDGRKIVLSDTDHLWGIGGNQAWVWKTFLRGHHVLFMDPYDGVVLGNKFDPRWDPVRRSLGYTRQFAERMDLAKATPRNALASSGYCLANPGQEYLVYQPKAGASFTVKLPQGTFRFAWFNPTSGQEVKKGSFRAKSGQRKFSPPFKNDAVLFLRRE